MLCSNWSSLRAQDLRITLFKQSPKEPTLAKGEGCSCSATHSLWEDWKIFKSSRNLAVWRQSGSDPRESRVLPQKEKVWAKGTGAERGQVETTVGAEKNAFPP